MRWIEQAFACSFVFMMVSGCGQKSQHEAEELRARPVESTAKVESLELEIETLRGLSMTNEDKLQHLSGRWKFLVDIETDSIRALDRSIQEVVIDGTSWKWLINGEVQEDGVEIIEYDLTTAPVSFTRHRTERFAGERISRGILKVDADHLIMTLTPLEDPGNEELEPFPESFAPYGTDNSQYLLERVEIE